MAINNQFSRASPPRLAPRDGKVRVEALRCYSQLVDELGGNPRRLLARAKIPTDALEQPDAWISYRAMINLLESSARDLDCIDFGLRLASRQGGTAVLGPLDLAMRNSSTVGEAFRYCAGHLQVYSPVVQIAIEEDQPAGRHLMHFEIFLRGISTPRQTVENALGLTHFAVLTLSGGRFGAREIWFKHEPVMPLARYRKYLSAKLRFNAAVNAVVFQSSDLAQTIPNPDRQVYELAAQIIDQQYPTAEPDLVSKVRLLTGHRLEAGRCTPELIAAQLGMHPRTLQRRLQLAGTSFETIKDSTRRDVAAYYLTHSDLSLTRVATLLGYSETSVLTRSCQRWFGCTPKTLRTRSAP